MSLEGKRKLKRGWSRKCKEVFLLGNCGCADYGLVWFFLEGKWMGRLKSNVDGS